MKCVHCGEELTFAPGKGWVHASDGKLYRQRVRTPDEIDSLVRQGRSVDPHELIDDHCALPDRSGTVS